MTRKSLILNSVAATLFTLFFLWAIERAGAQPVQNTSVSGWLEVKGGNAQVGVAPINKAVSMDLQSSRLRGLDQYGLNANVHCGNDTISAADSTCTEFRAFLQTDVSYHIPYGYGVHISTPTIGVNAGFRHLCGVCVETQAGADSVSYGFHQIGKGRNVWEDTSEADAIAIYKAGINFHGSNNSTSRKLTDSDYVLIVDNSGGILKDTLPQISKSVGRPYVFFQLKTGGAFPFRLFPFAGEKIDNNDSVSLQSNLGRARMRVFNIGSRWEVEEIYQEGIFTATGTGFAATVPADTGFWIQNGLQYFLRIKPLVGTSNTTSFGITGMGAPFTISGLDTTYTATATALGYNNGSKVAAQCVMPLSGADVTCSNVSSGYAAWTNALKKGIAYGIEFSYRLPKYPGF